MSATEIISLAAMLVISGGVASYLAQRIKREAWSARIKYVLALVLSGVVGLATAWLAGDVLGIIHGYGSLTAADVFAFLGGVYAAGQAFYVFWFKPRAE